MMLPALQRKCSQALPLYASARAIRCPRRSNEHTGRARWRLSMIPASCIRFWVGSRQRPATSMLPSVKPRDIFELMSITKRDGGAYCQALTPDQHPEGHSIYNLMHD